MDYNIDHGNFIDRQTGETVTEGEIEKLLHSRSENETSEIGSATAKRTAFLKSLLREIHRSGLDKLSRQPDKLKRIELILRNEILKWFNSS